MPKTKEATHNKATLGNIAGILRDLAGAVENRANEMESLGIKEVPVKAGTMEAINAKDRVAVFLNYLDEAIQIARKERSDYGAFKEVTPVIATIGGKRKKKKAQ